MSAILDPNASAVKEWSVKLDRKIVAAPAVDDEGTLYLPTDQALIAMDSETTEIKWKKPMSQLQMGAAPVVTGDSVYVTTGNFAAPLTALNRSDGETRWTKEKGELPGCSLQAWAQPTPEGLLYAGRWPGSVHLIDADGKEKWSHELGGEGTVGSQVACTSDGLVYQVSSKVTASKNGEFLWQKAFDSVDSIKAGSKPTVTPDDGLLYTTNNGKLRKLNNEGEVEWEFSAQAGKRLDQFTVAERQAMPHDRDSSLMTSTPIISDDGRRIYAGGWDKKLYCLDAEGNELWRKEMPMRISHSGVKLGDDGTLYAVGDQEGYVYAMNPEDGKLLWHFTSNEKNTPSSVSVFGDRVILASMTGSVHALSSLGLLKALEREPDSMQPDASIDIDLGDGVITIGDIAVERH